MFRSQFVEVQGQQIPADGRNVKQTAAYCVHYTYLQTTFISLRQDKIYYTYMPYLRQSLLFQSY